MNSFQNTVLLISSIILVLYLLFVAYLMHKTKATIAYPPVVADCPDYWLDQSNGNSSACINTKNLGKSSCPATMDFSTSNWIGNQGLCNKAKWAKACDLTWDGITNNAKSCVLSK